MTTPYNLPILGELDKAIEKACEEGDIRFRLISSFGYNPLTNILTLQFQEALPELESTVCFKRTTFGKIKFDPRVENLDYATFNFDGCGYQTSSRSVLLAAKNLLKIVARHEILTRKISVIDTGHFNEFYIPRMPWLEAPKNYHTDHELSQHWKEQIMGVR